VLDAALDSVKYGDVNTYFCALFNDRSCNFGLMNQDGRAEACWRCAGAAGGYQRGRGVVHTRDSDLESLDQRQHGPDGEAV
jgi:hypothetical protein